jgi:hypothetical protein
VLSHHPTLHVPIFHPAWHVPAYRLVCEGQENNSMQLLLNFLAVEPTPAYECDLLYFALFFIIIITVILFYDIIIIMILFIIIYIFIRIMQVFCL